ncbi:MAG: type II toxin-antitoxin system RelE/ParE family toxin [Bacteroidales bacterium]|nr:type II toxin-antitoxin system RelE/ParE family toxin [Bacteroidales bacterium]MCF8458101.1 type II toxin-antitoxin system RelE/ParE family toxin [Bacteroidales bacterium]
MEIKIEWSFQSRKQLHHIYSYYSKKANFKVAKKTVKSITDRTSILFNNPLAGPEEELLSEYTQHFRYLVEGNYKIIYWIEQDVITISSVFDCRQDPLKMMKL